MIKLIKGDCLIESDKIEGGSVDLILTDLPYGTMKTRDYSIQPNQKEGSKTAQDHQWDSVIDTEKIMQIANRILRKNGKMILTAQDPFSTELKNKAIPNLPYNYSCVWEKSNFANCLLINKACANFYEDILIFSKSEDIKINPIKEYTNKIRAFINKKNYDIYDDFKNAGFKKYAVLDTFNSDKARRYNFHTLETYNNLIELYRIDKMEGFKPFEDAFKIYRDFEDATLSTFNLWEGKKFKSNILKYDRSDIGHHPTQKPVLLLEDLIKTFSNENDLVVDLTMGSGSAGVACVNTNRDFIGIELDDKYFNIAEERINNPLNK